MDLDLRMKMVSKTTFKLRSSEALTSEDDFELMEIPLSPTHFDQPPTPDHDPPSALEAETAIMNVLNNIRSVSIFFVKFHVFWEGQKIRICLNMTVTSEYVNCLSIKYLHEFLRGEGLNLANFDVHFREGY